ncbi:retroviral-like aspartic protease family protein [Cellulophaga sp. 20_2_10]|uniref:retropepsin-like aspartic protease n=1 Tax=Cellulophaga sp. 20_2_10 TaxID=2942476 RepID=UPI00201B12D7|nr:retropepsin-like aspartic protease [Cellulophaga sp. 20_2_10]MCL5246597.1 retroviral-like aspartic protease family protein [Cellulophaga sp. 20_2_10]
MKITRIFIYSIILILISSCATSKAVKYFKEGKTKQGAFKVTLPFEVKNGWIIIPVEINNKNYNFLLDTGTPTLVSKELAQSLNLKVIDSVNVSDVFNKKQTNKYTRIETIQIGKIDFIETVALINDFNSVPIWSSLNIDGFIGSSLMQHAVWDIDFNNKQITITDNESKLSLPEKIIENKLFIGYAGIPSIACKINGEKVWNFDVDFGYNGGLVIPFSEFKKQKENGKITDFTKSKTTGAIGIYGKQDNERISYSGIINELEFGNTILKNQKVYSEQYLGRRFGSDFFKNYRVILNWKSKKIKLIEKSNSK